MGLSSNMIDQEIIRSFSSWSLKWWWKCWDQIYEIESRLNWDNTPFLTCGPLLILCMSNVKHAYFMYITSTCIYSELQKSFMKFGIKSHETISYNLDWIALLSKWEYEMSTKPCYLTQMTLIGLYNKIYEGFMLSKCPENASRGQKGWFKHI